MSAFVFGPLHHPLSWLFGGNKRSARGTKRRRAMLCIEQLEDRRTPSVNVGASFLGQTNDGWAPPDGSIAVGPNHVVEAVNATLTAFTRTGTRVWGTGIGSLFHTGDPADVACFYDPLAGRFFVTGWEWGSDALFGVSKTSDPTQGWWTYRINVSLYVHFHHLFTGGAKLLDDVARRSFGLVRHDLLLQIDPSVSTPELVTS